MWDHMVCVGTEQVLGKITNVSWTERSSCCNVSLEKPYWVAVTLLHRTLGADIPLNISANTKMLCQGPVTVTEQ